MGVKCRLVSVIGSLGVRPMVRLSLSARRLLVYLAIQGRASSRAEVIGSLWPDTTEESARSNLRKSLWHLPSGWVAAVGDELVLEADCDLAEARAAARQSICGEIITFDEIALLSTDILPGWHDEWLMPVQDEFHLLRVQGLEAACRALLIRGDQTLAIQAGAAALRAEPLRESAAEALIDAHLAQSNRFEAVQCFRTLSKQLFEELGVGPSPHLEKKMAAITGAQAQAA